MKKETLIVIFYVLYFSWLFTITYLTQELSIINLFTSTVAVFYFIFLREGGDIVLFWLGALVPILTGVINFTNFNLNLDFSFFSYMPVWLPIAWGTTLVALRKLYIVIRR